MTVHHLQTSALQLVDLQLLQWPLAKQNYSGLKKVMVKTIAFDGFEVNVQYNPERMRSSAANVDAKAISERSCFLCDNNLPTAQARLPWGEGYQLLLNPYPIFEKHFTIPTFTHTPQLLVNRIGHMLDLVMELPDFVLFYNGARCGASAPDHFHFQAGLKGLLPIEADYKNAEIMKFHHMRDGVSIYHWPSYLRGVVTLVGDKNDVVVGILETLLKNLPINHANDQEPMVNMLVWFDSGQYVVHLFPRTIHRPNCFFQSGSEQVLISPASVDMDGFLVVPRLEDYEKIDEGWIRRIFGEVCFNDHDIVELLERI